MRRTIIYLRHGETEMNREKRFQGAEIDIDLNETGLEQASAWAKILKAVKIDIIFHSPLRRAKSTAEAIRSKQLTTQMREVPALSERRFGKIAGVKYDALDCEFKNRLWHFESLPDIYDIEDGPSFTHRAAYTIEQLTKQEFNVACVVGHAGFLAAFLAARGCFNFQSSSHDYAHVFYFEPDISRIFLNITADKLEQYFKNLDC